MLSRVSHTNNFKLWGWFMVRFRFFLIIAALVSPAVAFGKNVLMMVPDDFMWPEYELPLTAYKKDGHTVKVAGKYRGEVKPDRRNSSEFPTSRAVTVDMTFDEVKVEDFDAITFVAGNGAWHDFFPNETVHKIVQTAFDKEKVIGLLCASTGLLGLVGNFDGNGKPIAEGRKVVGYFRVEGILTKLGKVKFVAGDRKAPAAVIDGNLVTGRNPESSQVFAEKVVELLRK